MIGLKVVALGSLTVATVAEIIRTPVIKEAEHIGNMDLPTVFALIALVAVAGMVFVYRAKEKDSETARRDRELQMELSRKAHDEHTAKLYNMIEANTKAAQEHADRSKQVAGILVEVKDAIRGCKNNHAV